LSSRSRGPWNDDDEHRLFKNALDQVELADRLGYDYISQAEHHFLEEYSHELFAENVMPEFHEHHAEHDEWKHAVLDGDIVLTDVDTSLHYRDLEQTIKAKATT
jgi:hypothetical protein